MYDGISKDMTLVMKLDIITDYWILAKEIYCK